MGQGRKHKRLLEKCDSRIFIDRGDDDEIAIFIEHQNAYYIYCLDYNAYTHLKSVRLERYLGIFLAEKVGVTSGCVFINGWEKLEDDLTSVLKSNFKALSVEVVGKNTKRMDGFRLTSELLYYVMSLKLQSKGVVCFQKREKSKLEVNQLINALQKKLIQAQFFQPIIMSSTDEIDRLSIANFLEGLNISQKLLNQAEITYCPYGNINSEAPEEPEFLLEISDDLMDELNRDLQVGIGKIEEIEPDRDFDLDLFFDE